MEVKIHNQSRIDSHQIRLSKLTWYISGPVNWLLSLSVFQFFAKLTYCLYLLHRAVQNYNRGIVRVPIIFTNYTIVSTVAKTRVPSFLTNFKDFLNISIYNKYQHNFILPSIDLHYPRQKFINNFVFMFFRDYLILHIIRATS